MLSFQTINEQPTRFTDSITNIPDSGKQVSLIFGRNPVCVIRSVIQFFPKKKNLRSYPLFLLKTFSSLSLKHFFPEETEEISNFEFWSLESTSNCNGLLLGHLKASKRKLIQLLLLHTTKRKLTNY
jgi:hypothetical protein